LDTDGDGIPNYKEKEYGTDPNKPNYLLAYALKKLPEQEALKFKNVENFNESSKEFIDYYVSLPENIRNSKEVNDLLNQILSDNIINELEKNLFYDKFVFPNLPLIFNLEWFPTREKLDKIYDINVTFIAKDDNTPIVYAELRFIPVEYYYMIEKYGMRQEDYPKVFPPDNERIYVLTPIDGKFDSLEERFSVSISDIIGGREYEIVVLIRDLAGNERTTETITPYIRQFENLGKELYKKGIIVMANYFPLYPNPHSWKALEPMAVHPILGKYDVTDGIVIYKHVDWATGHGINTFIFSWPIHWGSDSEKVLRNIDRIISNSFNQIYFSFQVEGVDTAIEWNPNVQRNGWKLILKSQSNWKVILEGDTYVNSITKLKPYLQHENYLKVGSRPFIFLFNTARLYGNVEEFYNAVRKALNNAYLMCNYVDTWAASSTYTKDRSGGWLLVCEASGNCELIRVANSADANTVWAAGWYTPIKEPLEFYYPKYLEEAYSIWSKLASKYGWAFIPSIIPGFINLRDEFQEELPRSKQMFLEILKTSFKHGYTPEGIKILKIDTFNEFGEATGIEPTSEEGFSFLETLRNFFFDLLKI
jgi:hypothetical protein